jgi:ribosome-interacting GTPase 1
VLDVFQPHHQGVLKKELAEAGIRLDERPPNILIEKTSTGGMSVNAQVPIKTSERLIKEIMRLYGLHNGRLIIREPNLSDDQLIDALNGNRIYLPSVIVLNKIDLVNASFVQEIKSKIVGKSNNDNFIAVSADSGINIDVLKEAIYQRLGFIRVYMRPKGGETDFREPMIIKDGATVQDVCNKIHRNLAKNFRYGLVWGKSAKFDGQKVGLDHKLADEDVLTIVKISGTST